MRAELNLLNERLSTEPDSISAILEAKIKTWEEIKVTVEQLAATKEEKEGLLADASGAA